MITIDEASSLGYEWYDNGSAAFWKKTENTPTWLYNRNYWTSSPYNDDAHAVWIVGYDGGLGSSAVIDYYAVMRPVIVLPKSAITTN